MNSLPADSPVAASASQSLPRLPCLVRLSATVMSMTCAGNLLIRLFGVATLAPGVGAQTNAHEWMTWLWYGFRYDLLLVSWGMAVWLLPLAILRVKYASTPLTRTAFTVSVTAWFVILNALALAEHYYLRHFGEPFGANFFSVLDGDTATATDATTHLLPIAMALTSAACLGVAQAWGTFRYVLVPEREATWRDAIVQVLVVSIVLIVGWGRPSARLVDPAGISVARDPVLDDLLVNTPVRLILVLRQVWEPSREDLSPKQAGQAAQRALRAHGFADAASLVKALRGDESDESDESGKHDKPDGHDDSVDDPDATRPADAEPTHAPDEDPTAVLLRAPWHRTPPNDRLAAHPPHVVFGLMAGWGGYGLSLDADGFPIAGAMRRHLDAGWWFRHAVAARADTFSTIEHLLVNSGSASSLLTGENRPVAFESASARPFQQHGYRTVFVYGGARTWHSIERVMRRQGFDDVVTQADIVARYPRADTGGDGVYDGYLWRYVHDLLEEADAKGQPLFVFALTTSNREPFNVPDDAATGPFDLTKGWRESPADAAERETRQRGVRAYRYAMDALGDFIDRLKYSPMSSHTILAATGDHLAPQWHDQDNAFLSPFEQYHVPIYLRVPPAYAPSGRLRLDDFVGHRDIFPTLYRLALSDAAYVGFGEPLFGAVPQTRRYAVAQQRYLFSTAGARDLRSGVTYAHADEGDPALLRQQAVDANTSLALADWYGEMQRRETSVAGGK
ncbi:MULTISPECIES: LTA synthase family protein [Pandoraea]|uniref:LTA synthase family protein n=1 Tax=Pandoraea TaxID=93217 RepID=UPI001F5D2CC3|nr:MULTISPECIES: LTA synthase family protein [Pandoraea]MCI3203810.1 hypothetical protein [Pandoraea sp. LA3]MDN4581836.1 hypothetical protein [Pandoraea capi]